MRLPNSDQAIIDPRKVRDYLLSLEHPVGRFKAHFFTRLGFASGRWVELRDQLQSVALRGTIVGTAGRKAKVLTAWIILDGEKVPRFVTAYPEN